MPTLRKHKEDDSYYIRTSIPPAGYITYQVRPEGIRWLKQFGFVVDEHEDLPTSVLKQLIQHDFVFKKGEGGSDPVIPLLPSSSVTPTLPLRLVESEGKWALSLALPEFPKQWWDGSSHQELISTLGRCFLKIEDKVQLSAMTLWPGKGGSTVTVLPHTEPYTVKPDGPWPLGWDLAAWTCGASGLNPQGTLFEDGGYRLTPGAVLGGGSLYYLLYPAQQATRLPPSTNPQLLAVWTGWRLWSVQLPEQADAELQRWCQSLGRPFEAAPWQLRLLAPPPHRLFPGAPPQMTSGTVALICIAPPPEHATSCPAALCLEHNGTLLETLVLTQPREGEDDSSSLFLQVPLTAIGTYRLWAPDGRVRSLSWEVVSPSAREEAHWIGPSPLEVELGGWHRRAIGDGRGPHDLRLETVTNLEALVVHCPVPLVWTWWYGDRRRQRSGGEPEENAAHFIADCREVLLRGHLVRLHLDAGTFGTLWLHLKVEHRIAEQVGVPPFLVGRARALAQQVQLAQRHSAQQLPLPPAIQRALAPLLSVPGAEGLATLSRVPSPLLSHVVSLAHALSHTGNSPLPLEGTS